MDLDKRLLMENQALRNQVAQLEEHNRQLSNVVKELASRLLLVKRAWAKLPESATGGLRASQW